MKQIIKGIDVLEGMWEKSTYLERCILKIPGGIVKAALRSHLTKIIVKPEYVEIHTHPLLAELLTADIHDIQQAFKKPVEIIAKEEKK